MKNERQFRCLSGIKNLALASGELPTRLKFLNWGENPAQGGVVVVNDSSVAALTAQIADKAFERIVIDFEHNSEPRHENYQKPPRFHAGYGTLRAIPQDGVYLDAIEWTPGGRQFAREYSDLSPTVLLDKADGKTVTMVKSLALCPNGALHDVTFFSADSGSDNQPQEKTMSDEALRTMTATIEAQTKSIALLSGTVDAQKTEIGKLIALNAKVTELETGLTGIRADLAARERALILERAAREGKAIPLSADEIAKMDLKTLSAMVDKLPATVPVSRLTPAHAQPATADEQKKAEQRAATVRTLAGEIQAREGLSYMAAFNRAEAQVK